MTVPSTAIVLIPQTLLLWEMSASGKWILLSAVHQFSGIYTACTALSEHLLSYSDSLVLLHIPAHFLFLAHKKVQTHTHTHTRQETTKQEGDDVTRNSSYPCCRKEGRKIVRLCVLDCSTILFAVLCNRQLFSSSSFLWESGLV